MIGRLVEQQQFGVGHERTRERDAFLEPARQRFDAAIGFQAQTLQRFFDPAVKAPGIVNFEFMRQTLQIVKRVHIPFCDAVRRRMIISKHALGLADTLGNGLEYRMARLELRLLRNIGELQRGLAPYVAGVGRVYPGNDFKQTRFSGAVTADQPDPLSRLDNERRAVQQGPMAIGQFKTIKSKQGHDSVTVKTG